MNYDILITNAEIPSYTTRMTLGIKNGMIAAIISDRNAYGSELRAQRIINAKNYSVTAGFVDSHTHLDKALTSDKVTNHSGTLIEAIRNFDLFFSSTTEEEVYTRAKKTVAMAIQHGTTAIRTHATLNVSDGLLSIRALEKLKREMKDYIDIQIVAFPTFPSDTDFTQKNSSIVGLIHQAFAQGADLLGGCPSLTRDHKQSIDVLIRLARQHGVPLDLHIDESDEPNVEALEYLADAVIQERFPYPVVAGHCTALSVVDTVKAERVLSKVRDAGIRIITLPSCNMYLILGQLFALVTAGCWAHNSIVYAAAGKRVGSQTVTHIRTWVAFPAIIIVHLFFRAGLFPWNISGYRGCFIIVSCTFHSKNPLPIGCVVRKSQNYE